MLELLLEVLEPLSAGMFMLKMGGSKSKSSSQQQSTNDQFQGLKDADTIAAVKNLIAVGGMTPDLARQRAVRADTLANLNTTLAGYTKEKAFSDSSEAMQGLLRQLRETSSPAISRAVESSGASGSSMSALLTNDADARNAQATAKLALDAATQYGGITSNLFGTAGSMTATDTTATQALLQAIDDMKVSIGQAQSTGSAKSSSMSFSAGKA